MHDNDLDAILNEAKHTAQHTLGSSPAGVQAAPGGPQQALPPELRKLLGGLLGDLLASLIKRLAGGILPSPSGQTEHTKP